MNNVSMLASIGVAAGEEMAKDEKVILVGEDLATQGSCWGYFTGFADKFGKDRVLNMPLCEQGYSLFSCGAAMMGYKPVVEFMFADFAALGFEAVADVSAKFRYNSGGKNSLPIVWLCPEGAGARSGCQHSQCVESWFANVPGLKIAAPTTPGDVRAFLRAAIEDPDPVLFCFHKAIFGIKEDIPDTLDEVPSLKNAAKIVKPGSDLTVVAYHRALLKCLEAAEQVEKETGKTIEIIDPRVLIPFDKEALYKSVKKTGRLLVSHEAPERGGFGAQIIAYAMEECAGDMKSNPVSVCGKNIPIPWGTLEDYALPSAADIKAGMLKALE
ncbi:MAG: alpha-ketoacid dehydrogenase subunit beta [Eubacteriaceae bacterium]|jgi:pyruvate dehydrogenase E1 component beta subunit|nr:alpha-ketoacid dehydrogenase subunit beta [Eubacteriaceae bacterium]